MANKRHQKGRGRAAADFFGGRRIERDHYKIRNRKYRKTTSTNKKAEETTNGTTEETPTREELLKELGIINLSLETVKVIVFATLLNLYYVYSLKAQTIDALCDTDLSSNFGDTTNFPRITNDIFLYTTGVFLTLNYTLFQESVSEHKDDLDNKEVGSARRSFLASLFTFLAVTLSRNNLEL